MSRVLPRCFIPKRDWRRSWFGLYGSKNLLNNPHNSLEFKDETDINHIQLKDTVKDYWLGQFYNLMGVNGDCMQASWMQIIHSKLSRWLMNTHVLGCFIIEIWAHLDWPRLSSILETNLIGVWLNSLKQWKTTVPTSCYSKHLLHKKKNSRSLYTSLTTRRH